MSIVETLAEMTARWNAEDVAELVAERDALRARAAELEGALRSTLEALEASFPGDESVGLQEFPAMSMAEAWRRRLAARKVLAKASGTAPAPPGA